MVTDVTLDLTSEETWSAEIDETLGNESDLFADDRLQRLAVAACPAARPLEARGFGDGACDRLGARGAMASCGRRGSRYEFRPRRARAAACPTGTHGPAPRR